MAGNNISDSDSSENENMPELKICKDQFVVGKTYHWGKLLTAPIGRNTIFKTMPEVTVTRKCHLIVIMRHDAEMKHPSLSPEWKVQRILLKKYMFSQDFMNIWTGKEAMNNEFVETIRKLPCIFTPEKFEEFKAFFQEYGHGFLKSGYVGGEVYLKIIDEHHFDSINYHSEQDPLLKMKVGQSVFRGGSSAFHEITKDHLEQWRDSLYENPVEIILDQDMDVIFYHDFVPGLTWLRNKQARGQALEEAFNALKNTFLDENKTVSYFKEKNDRGLMTHISPLKTLVPNSRIAMDSAYLSYLSQRKASEADSFRPGKGFNIVGTMLAHDVLRPKHVGDSVVDLKVEGGFKVEKLHESVNDAENGNGVVSVGMDSFTIKVPLIKHMLTQLPNLLAKECTLHSVFRATLKGLPKCFSYSKLAKFKAFFDMFGQAVLLSIHSGGEARCTLTSNDEGFTAEEVLSALSAVNCPGLRLSGDGGKRYLVSFKGGLDELKQLDKLPEWIASLDANPCQVVFDWERDVMFYHDFVHSLSWLKDGQRKAKALKKALIVYLDEQEEE